MKTTVVENPRHCTPSDPVVKISRVGSSIEKASASLLAGPLSGILSHHCAIIRPVIKSLHASRFGSVSW